MQTANSNLISIQGSLFDYIGRINKIPMLTIGQEVEYIKLKDKGNIEAVKMLVSSHLRLVVKIAFKYKNYHLPLLDLIQEGNIGLMRAVKGFKLDKGCRFATYATWWIRAYIQEYILKAWSLVKIGTTIAQKKLFFNLRKIKNQILSHDRKCLNNVEMREIANECGVEVKDVAEMEARLTSETSLNSKVQNSDEKVELADLLEDKQKTPDVVVFENKEQAKRQAILKQALASLDSREKDIIYRRRLTDNPAKLKVLATKYKISNERVRQIENKALKKIKQFVQDKIN